MKTFSRHRFRERRGVNLDNNIISEEKANIKRRTFNLQYCVTDVFCGGGRIRSIASGSSIGARVRFRYERGLGSLRLGITSDYTFT